MELNDKELVKSLTSLIDETLEEIEEIKKSKYAASEVKIEGPGDGIAGKPVNGELDAKKKEDDEDEDKDKKDEMDKGENEKADEDAGKFAEAPTVSKGENEKADEDAGKFAEAPTISKGEEDQETKRGRQPQEEGDTEEDHDKKEKKMKKSVEESESLMKSYVDTKFVALEERLSKMAEMIESIADAPVERKGIPSGVKPLHKSADHAVEETLTKSDVADKLFELKKSGTHVDSSDIFQVEVSKNYNELKAIADKYGVK